MLIVSQYFWPENFRINDLAAALVARGHSVTVLTGYPNYPDGKIFAEFAANPAGFAEHGGAQVVRVPMLARGTGAVRLALNYAVFAVSASIVGLWKLRGREFDAIFAYEPSPVTVGIPAAVLRRAKRAPLAFWVLDLWPETLAAVGVVRSAAILRAVGALVSVIYSQCDLILAQSRSFIPQIANYCTDAAKIIYFPSWAEPLFADADAAPAAEVPICDGSFSIMFAGNIGQAQDFPAVLQAAELLKDDERIRWLIVGDGRMAAWVRAQVVERGLEHRVLMLGRYPVDRMPSFYRHADALLVSLKNEPIFGMTIPSKLQSYLAAGVPVLAMLNGEGANIVKQSCAGFACAAGDARGLADAVRRLAALTEEERAQLGRNALAVSASEFDRETLIGRLEAALKTTPYRASQRRGT